VVAGALAVALAGKGNEFLTALGSAPLWVLAAAVGLHIFWLVARSEAWSVCIVAAGGSVSRRRLCRASSVGYLGNIFTAISDWRSGSRHCDAPRPRTALGPMCWSRPSCRS
jgi:uncharacterized membrane protein YbhN (UPF0104 family)